MKSVLVLRCFFQIENLVDNLPSKLKHFVLVTGTKHYMGPFELFEEIEKRGDVQTPFKVSCSL